MRDPFRLPQTLLLPPGLAFAAIRGELRDLGFEEAATGLLPTPLIDGEPEAAAWAWPGGLPRIDYAFNPVVRLRVLDVGTVPPRTRALLAERLGALPPESLRQALGGDERQRLWGVCAALETERLDLVHDIGRLAESARGSLRDDAERAARRLAELADLRLETLTGARLIATAALDLIAELHEGEAVRRQLPGPADCARLFVPQIADRVAEAVAARRWPLRGLAAEPEGPEDVFAGPAGVFRWPNEISDRFPNGYRTIAGWMQPGRIWIGWAGKGPEGEPLRFDGLVFCDGRWVFLPKPYRLVEPLLPALPEAPPSWSR